VFEQGAGKIDGRSEVFVKRLVVALAVLGALSAVAVAQGAVVQEFSFQLKSVKPDGRFTVVFNSRSYDTTGGIPDALTQNIIRLPKGGVIRKQFIKKKYYCDLKKFVDMLRVTKPASTHFDDFLNQKLRGKKTPPKSAKDLIAVCRFARVGSGTVLVDARPFVEPPIPAKIEMFWATPNKGAVGTMAIVGSPDESAAIVRDNPTIRDTHPIVNVDFVDDPTPDGLYEYKIVLPTGPVAGIRISVAEVHVTTPGLTLVKTTAKCTKKKRGRCVKKKVKKTNLFWFTQPTCPANGQLSFQAFYAYANSPSQTKTTSIPCPKFKQ
jgi:hypothetical protein